MNGKTSEEVHQYGTLEKTLNDAHEGKPLLKDNKSSYTPLPEGWSSCLGTNILISITFFSYGMGIICSQLTGANILQINCLRFVIISILGFIAVCLHKCTLKIEHQHTGILLICVLLHQVHSTAFYYTASFMPAGSFEGLHGAFATVVATVYDICKKKVSKLSALSAMGAVIGVVLLTQPWRDQKQVHLMLSPCQYLENASQPFTLNISNSGTFQIHRNQYDNLQLWFQKYKSIIGYMLVIILSATSVTRGIFIRKLLCEYPVPTVMFWHTTIEAIPTIILNLIWSNLFTKSFFDKPSGSMCLVLTLLFLAFAVSGNGLGFYVYKHTHVSTNAIVSIALTMFLYASQRTFLRSFHPGHANAVEVIGIIVISFSVSVLRFISFIIERNKNIVE